MHSLLDTHAFLWWFNDDAQFSKQARTIIADTNNEIFFSAASGWEIAIKTQIGKLRFPSDLERFILEQLRDNNFMILPMHLSHTLHIYTLPLLHRDPFDRVFIPKAKLKICRF